MTFGQGAAREAHHPGVPASVPCPDDAGRSPATGAAGRPGPVLLPRTSRIGIGQSGDYTCLIA
ncbi:hypothetical protein [Streptomyces flaveolus]|uniref:hypothetical protein n=1 Tax=Streptomyces flaveolus TaxID=67297 RepID=UPI0036F5FCB3